MRGGAQSGQRQTHKFWNDVWLGDTPLRIQFPKLLSICYMNQDARVREHMENQWDIRFRRMLGQEEEVEWNALSELLQGVVDLEQDDTIEWALSRKKVFTTWPRIFGNARLL